jgi:hypothetical protein
LTLLATGMAAVGGVAAADSDSTMEEAATPGGQKKKQAREQGQAPARQG